MAGVLRPPRKRRNAVVNVRLDGEAWDRVTRAALLLEVPVTAFVREAALQRAALFEGDTVTFSLGPSVRLFTARPV